MINMPNRFKQALLDDKRNFELSATITLKDSTQLTITNEELWSQGFEIENEVSGNSTFDIGGFIIGRMRLVINNIYNDYTQYDFFDASVDVTLTLQTGNYRDSIAFNDFTVDEPTENSAQIILSCLDNAKFFERPYSDSQLRYPTTLNAIVQNACTVCGVQYAKSTFNGGTYIVKSRPSDDGLTFLKVISWCAQASGNFARINHLGQLVIGWYDTDTFENTTILPNAITDTDAKSILDTDSEAIQDVSATGSDTTNGADWTISDTDLAKYHHVVSWGNLHTDTDDVVITGVNVVVEDDERTQHVGTYGTSGYVLEIANNELIDSADVQTIANTVGAKVVGLRFRAYNGSCLGDPTIEAGDLIWITDNKCRNFRSFICGTTFKLGQYQTLYCGATTPSRNSATQYSESTRAIVRERKKTLKTLTTYESNAQMLSKLISRGFGMYVTDVEQQDGSVISYMHDKPTIAQSSFICYMTSEGVLMESDGTTTAAVDKNGNALLNTLTARGINADWINTGTISSKDGSVSINLTNNTINLKGVTSFDGFATKTGLGTANYTTINGGNITTGVIKDSQSNTVFNLSDGTLTMKKGSINIGNGNFEVSTTGDVTIKQGSINIGSGAFSVSSTGALVSTSADIKGKLQSSTSANYVIVDNGHIYGGRVSSGNLQTSNGYISFNQRLTGGGYGTRVGGSSVLALLTPMLGVGDYQSFDSDATIYVGQSGTVGYVKSIQNPTVEVTPSYAQIFDQISQHDIQVMTGVSVSIAINHTTGSIGFTKGLMVTQLNS